MSLTVPIAEWLEGHAVMTPAKFYIKKYRSSDHLKSHPESLNNQKYFQSIRSTH